MLQFKVTLTACRMGQQESHEVDQRNGKACTWWEITPCPIENKDHLDGKQLERNGPDGQAEQEPAMHPGSKHCDPGAFWAMVTKLLPEDQKSWSFPSMQHWKGHTWNATSSSGFSSTRNKDMLDWFQGKTMEMINCCICHVTSVWKSWGYSAWRRLRGYLVHVYEHLTGRCREDGAWFFSEVPRDKTIRNVHKLKQRKFHLNIKNIFLLWGWSNFGTGQQSSSLEIFHDQQDIVLNNLL